MKHQPTKDQLKDQLALAAEEIIRLNTAIDTTKVLMGWDRPPPKRERSTDTEWLAIVLAIAGSGAIALAAIGVSAWLS